MKTPNLKSVSMMVGIIVLTSVDVEGQSNWLRKANMPTARSGLCACVVDGKIYAMGGGVRNQVVTAIVEQYDPVTDTWTRKAGMQTARTFFGASALSGKIYVFGGWAQGGAYLSSCEEYDPVADTWTTKASMSTTRCFLSAVAANGKIYVLGGGTRVGGNTPGYPTFAVLAVEEYDPVTDTWATKADMPRPAGVPSCAVVDGIIYCAGGGNTTQFGTGTDRAVRNMEVYNPTTDSWTSKSPMLMARTFFSTFAVNGTLYALGGCTVGGYDSSETANMEAYGPATNTWWRLAPMQAKRKGLASVVVNGRVYAIGGVAQAGWEPALSIVEEYDPTPTVTLLRTGNTLKISWNGILESNDTMDGPDWQALNPTTWPYSISLTSAPMKFYRARTP